MQLLIDPTGGIAGDMFSAALISMGANSDAMTKAMTLAGIQLGSCNVHFMKTADQAGQLRIELIPNHHHLSAEQARKILNELFNQLDITPVYKEFGFHILQILAEAEKKAHATHHHLFAERFHHHHHHDTLLHEAQDIIIDIIGMVKGMQDLKINIAAGVIGPVSVGSGTVEFSHGILPVPAPATKEILETYHIQWQSGPLETELCTPTGAAILAALNPIWLKESNVQIHIQRQGMARGSKLLDLPPLKISIIDDLTI